MNRETLMNFNKRNAELKKQEDKDIEQNPLLQYSTSQLKEELKRRKRQ